MTNDVLLLESCCRRIGDLRWQGSLSMVPLENNAKRLSSVNDTTKTIRHYYHHELLLPILPYNFFYFHPVSPQACSCGYFEIDFFFKLSVFQLTHLSRVKGNGLLELLVRWLFYWSFSSFYCGIIFRSSLTDKSDSFKS